MPRRVCDLDRAGLLAFWREGLLAGTDRGHAQLQRFHAADPVTPSRLVTALLWAVLDEATHPGHNLNKTLLRSRERADGALLVTSGHLAAKLKVRSPDDYTPLNH